MPLRNVFVPNLTKEFPISIFCTEVDIFGRISKIESWESISVLVRLQLLEPFPLRKKLLRKIFEWFFRWNFSKIDFWEKIPPKLSTLKLFSAFLVRKVVFWKAQKCHFTFKPIFMAFLELFLKVVFQRKCPYDRYPFLQTKIHQKHQKMSCDQVYI